MHILWKMITKVLSKTADIRKNVSKPVKLQDKEIWRKLDRLWLINCKNTKISIALRVS